MVVAFSAIVRQALHQRTGAIADADDADVDGLHDASPSGGAGDRLGGRCRGVAVDHPGAEIREGLRIVDRADVMGGDAQMFGRAAEGDGDVEIASASASEDAALSPRAASEDGRASCGEKECQSGEITVAGVSVTKKQ